MGPRRATHSTQLVPEPVSLSDQHGMLLWHNKSDRDTVGYVLLAYGIYIEGFHVRVCD